MKTLRILTFKGRGISRPILSSINTALEDLGHSVKCIDREDFLGSRANEIIPELIQDIRAFDPHLAIFYGVYGIIPVNTKNGEETLFDVLKIPYASLFFDDPFISFPIYSKYYSSPFYHMFVFDRVYVDRLRELGFKRVYPLQIGTDPAIFKKMELSEDDLRRYQSDVSFVGHIFMEDGFKEERGSWGPLLNNIVDQAVRIKLQRMSIPIPVILNEVRKALPQKEREWFDGFLNERSSSYFLCQIYKECDSLHRKRIIEGLDIMVDLWGVDEGIFQNARIHGWIDYGHDLAKLYNATRINLDITTTQSITSPTQRIFDVSACGGFILTDYHKALNEFFKPGDEIIYYKDIEDLRRLVHYYLDHPDEREEIAARAHKRTLMEHTYRHRMAQLIEMVGYG